MRRPNSFEASRPSDRAQGDRPNHSRRPISPKQAVSREVVQELLSQAYIEEQKSRSYAEAELARQSAQFAAAIAARETLAASHLKFEEALDLIVARAAEITSAHGAAIALEQGAVVVCRARCGVAPSLGAQVDPAIGFSGRCLLSGEVQCCEDTLTDPRVTAEYRETTEVRSVLGVPIRRGQRVFGILEVYSPFVAAFSTTEVRTLQLLAGSVVEAAGARELPKKAPVAYDAEPPCSEGTAPALATQTESPVDPRADAADALEKDDAPAEIITGEHNPPSRPGKWFVRALVIGLLTVSGWLAVRMSWQRNKVSAPPARTASAPPAVTSPPEAASEAIQVGPIQFHSRPEVTTVNIDLSAAVSFTAARLDRPDRLYFDLEGAGLAFPTQRAVEVNDSRVRRIRTGTNEKGGTRLVLDLNCSCAYTAMVTEVPPFRLVVVVHSSTGTAAGSRPDSPETSSATVIKETAVAESRRWTDLKIVIDPGHGGSDVGAVGSGGLQEKELVLDVAQRLGALVTRRMGAQVIYTRTTDVFVPLQSRSALASTANADLLLSIHGNSSGSRNVKGVETFYGDATSLTGRGSDGVDQRRLRLPSRTFAAALQTALYKSLVVSEQDFRNRGIKPRALTVLERPSLPAALTEIGFLTSPAEEKKLEDAKYRDRIAEALYQGLATFVSASVPHLPKSGAMSRSEVGSWRVDEVTAGKASRGER